MRRTSALFPYARAAFWHVERPDANPSGVEFARSMLAYFAAGDFMVLRYLVEAVRVEEPEAKVGPGTTESNPVPSQGTGTPRDADGFVEGPDYGGT